MPTNTYPDGFPLNPLEAINFSYFLSESEKQEWRDWLKSATPEQQNELVDILHSMWQDNQKQAVPSAFATNQTQPQRPQETAIPPAGPLPDFNPNPIAQGQPPVQQRVQAQPAAAPSPWTPAPLPTQTPNQLPPFDPFATNTSNASSQPQPNQPFGLVDNPFAQPFNPFAQAQVQTQVQTTPLQPVQIEPQQTTTLQPDPFSSAQPITQAPVSTPEPQPQSQQAPATQAVPSTVTPQPEVKPETTTQEEDEFDFTFDTEPFDDDEVTGTGSAPAVEQQPSEKQSDQDEAIKKMATQKYTPNPILDDSTPRPSEFVYKNGQDKASDEEVEDEFTDTDKDSLNIVAEPKEISQERIKKEKERLFSSSKLRQSSTKQALEEVYKAYIESRAKSFDTEREFEENHAVFLDKIMQVVVNFEQIADYYESIIEKILEVNDQVVSQAKDIQQLKNTSQSRAGVSLQDQIDEMRDDIERIYRDLRVTRSEQRRKYDEVSQQLASFGADAYRQGGLMERLELMKSEIVQIQKRLNLPTLTTPRSDTLSTSKPDEDKGKS